MQFRKKPVVIEATQWFTNGDHPQDHDPIGIKNPTFQDLERYADYKGLEGKVVRYFRRPDVSGQKPCDKCGQPMHDHGWIDTLEGGHIVCPGDWIITGVQGERYPCKPDIFAKTYEPAEASPASVPEPIWYHKHWGDGDDIFYSPSDDIPEGATPLYAAPTPPVTEDRECNCTLAQKTVGDGCDVCNPELAAELREEQAAEDRQDAEQMQSDFNAAIKHAISLGLEAADFLRYWNEGDWDACAEFDFTPSEALRNPYPMQEGKP